MTSDDSDREWRGAELHEEWDSPSLWPRIQADLSAEPRVSKWTSLWRLALPAAAILILSVGLAQVLPQRTPQTADADFLTRDALREVERSEAGYARAIEKLAGVARVSLQESSTPMAAVYREKLLILDSAIADLKTHMEGNQYNLYLRNQLASLYREKQSTLEEWLKNAKDN